MDNRKLGKLGRIVVGVVAFIVAFLLVPTIGYVDGGIIAVTIGVAAGHLVSK